MYDFELIEEFCAEVGYLTNYKNPETFVVSLGEDIELTFFNSEKEDNCLVQFNVSDWHEHEPFIFDNYRDHCLELDYLDVLKGLAEGQIFVCDRISNGEVVERSLIHKTHFNPLIFDDISCEKNAKLIIQSVVPM